MSAADTLLLMTPGPTPVPDRVLRAGAQPMLHHRTPQFSRILVSTIEMLRPLYGTKGEILPVHTTGRGAMEASITNLLSAGDELIACCNGKFGEMWAEIAESYGLRVHRICTDWERAVDVAEVEAVLDAYPDTRALTIAWSDTSTGVLNDVASVLALTRTRNVLGMVDAISILGGAAFRFDEWGADVAVTASQKCLMCSPGLSFVAVSPRAWEAYETGRLPSNYWNFKAIQETLAQSQPETPGTSPVHLFMQAAEALTMIHEEGLARVFARHEAMAQMTRTRAAAIGLAPQCPALPEQSPTLTALLAPDNISPKKIREAMKRRGILLAGGLDRYADTAIRIGHMGGVRLEDVARTMDELAAVMHELDAGAVKPVASGRA